MDSLLAIIPTIIAFIFGILFFKGKSNKKEIFKKIKDHVENEYGKIKEDFDKISENVEGEEREKIKSDIKDMSDKIDKKGKELREEIEKIEMEKPKNIKEILKKGGFKKIS